MDVYLDHDPMPTDQRTLAGILAEGRRLATAAGRMIVEVRLDGRTLENSEVEQRAHAALDAEELQLVTADPLSLTAQALEDVTDALRLARGWQQEAAELLRTDQPRRALEQVQLALTVWGQAQQAVQAAGRILELDLDKLVVNGEPLTQTIEQMLARLADVREALGTGDWLGLADVLGYELDPLIDRWIAVMNDLRGRIS